jgi:hypothetical protein
MGNRYEKFAKELSALGYDVTPLAGKRPILKAWQQRPAEALDFKAHGDANIGVLTGGEHSIIAIDIDVKDEAAAQAIIELVTDRLGFAPQRIGAAPKTLFVFRCTESFRKTKTAIYEIAGQDACVEVLAEGQQFVASGKHPDTGTNYSWPDDSLIDVPPTKLTAITPNEIAGFIAAANNTLAGFGAIKSRSMSEGGGVTGKFDFAESPQKASLEKIEHAVMFIPNNDVHYDDWVYTAHAVKGAVGEDGFDLFDRWSKRSAKYDDRETARLWESIGDVKAIGAGTLIHTAKQYGYTTWEPEIDTTEAAEKVKEEYKEREKVDGELKATPFGDIAEFSIPRREFLYGTHLISKYVVATIAAGGGSKTTVILTDSVALATNRTLIGDVPKHQCNVWHYNLEDPLDELQRRVVAICKKYDIELSEIRDTLFLDSARDRKLIIAEKVGNIVVATPDVDAVIAEIKRNDIKVMSIDPFVKSHHVEENDNKQIDAVLDQYARIANETGCAIELAHHVRKPATGQAQAAGDINQARGASAISGAVRSARTIAVMSDKEAEAMGIPQLKRNWYIRVDDAKGNMSPPAEKARWLQRESIILDNGDEFEPGDSVGVVSSWTPPDPFDGISIDVVQGVLNKIFDGYTQDVRYSKNKGKRWAGNLLVDANLDVDEERARVILKIWKDNGVIYEETYRNGDTRKEEKGLFVNVDKIPGVAV